MAAGWRGRGGWSARRGAARVDPGQKAIIHALQSIGAGVYVIGLPLDLLVGLMGVTMLVEVKKAPGPRGGTRHEKGQHLNAGQEHFVEEWPGARPLVVIDPEDAVQKVRAEALRVLGLAAKLADLP